MPRHQLKQRKSGWTGHVHCMVCSVCFKRAHPLQRGQSPEWYLVSLLLHVQLGRCHSAWQKADSAHRAQIVTASVAHRSQQLSDVRPVHQSQPSLCITPCMFSLTALQKHLRSVSKNGTDDLSAGEVLFA